MSLIIKLAKTEDDLKKSFSVRYKVFVEEFGYMPEEEFPDKLEKDIYDSLPTTAHFAAIENNKGLAAARMIGPNKKMITDKNKMIFGLPMEYLFDFSDYKKHNIAPCEISRSSVIKSERSSRAMLDIWKIGVKYAKMNNIPMVCTCAGTETDSSEDAKIIYVLLKLKKCLHPDIVTKPWDEPETDFKSRFPLYDQKIRKEILEENKLTAHNLGDFESRGAKLPASLEYFTRLGGKATGPPALFHKFRMFTIPMVFDINNLNEPFKTFFERENPSIKL